MPPAVGDLRVRTMARARRWRDRLDAPEIRQARLLIKRLQTDPPDVLYLADSMAFFVSPNDTDTRQLRQMLADELAPEFSFLTIGGGGYHPRMFTRYLRLFERVQHRPVIIVPLSVRTTDAAWLYHPFHGHPRAVAKLERLNPRSPAWRLRMTSRAYTAEEMARHDRRPHPSLAGEDFTIADHRVRLKQREGSALDPAERLALLYAYHHTHLLDADDDGVQNITAMAQTLHDMRFPVVPYETAIPVQKGVELLGPAFRERAERNMAIIDKAFLRGYPGAEIVRSGFIFDTGEFLDPEDGSEHLNEHGRRKLLDAIVTRVQAVAPPTRV